MFLRLAADDYVVNNERVGVLRQLVDILHTNLADQCHPKSSGMEQQSESDTSEQQSESDTWASNQWSACVDEYSGNNVCHCYMFV